MFDKNYDNENIQKQNLECHLINIIMQIRYITFISSNLNQLKKEIAHEYVKCIITKCGFTQRHESEIICDHLLWKDRQIFCMKYVPQKVINFSSLNIKVNYQETNEDIFFIILCEFFICFMYDLFTIAIKATIIYINAFPSFTLFSHTRPNSYEFEKKIDLISKI